MGIYLSSPKTEKLSEDGENDRITYGVSNMQGWRASMEDAHAVIPDLDSCTSFFGVYDGHGGKVVAKFCAKYLHQVVKNEESRKGDLCESIQTAFLRMDEMMRGQRGWRELALLGEKQYKFSGLLDGFAWSSTGNAEDTVNTEEDDWALEQGAHEDFSGPTSGSTACVALIRNNQLIVANAGDSRCVLSRKHQAYNLSRDHKPDLENERERIVQAGGFIHAGRVNGSLNLARAIGDMEMKQNKFLPPEKQIITACPDINVVELSEDDEFIVLACDGICYVDGVVSLYMSAPSTTHWKATKHILRDVMSSQQLIDFIHEHINAEKSLSAVCEKVLDKCLAPNTTLGAGCDNMTIIIVQFKKTEGSCDA